MATQWQIIKVKAYYDHVSAMQNEVAKKCIKMEDEIRKLKDMDHGCKGVKYRLLKKETTLNYWDGKKRATIDIMEMLGIGR